MPRNDRPIKQENNLSHKDLIYFGSLALPLAFAGLPLYLYVPDFYISNGLSMTIVGIVLLAIRAFDSIQDPFIGYLSDKFQKMRCHIIFLSSFVLGLGIILLYTPPHQDYQLLWFIITLTISTLAFSTISINLSAFGSLWSKISHEKTRIVATKELFGIIGLLLAILSPQILNLFMSQEASFKIYALSFFIVTMICSFLFYKWQKKINPTALLFSETQEIPLIDKTKLSQISKLYPVLLCYGLSTLSSSIPGVLVIYYVRDCLQLTSHLGLFLSLYFITALLAIPLWRILSEKFGKIFSWILAMLIASLSFVWAYRLGVGDGLSFSVICSITGLSLGGELIIPPSLLSDMIDHHKLQHQTSFVFSIMHFLSKLSLALASGMALIILGEKGYAVGQEQNHSVIHILALLYALLPSLIKGLTAFLIYYLFKRGHYDTNTQKIPNDRHYHGT